MARELLFVRAAALVLLEARCLGAAPVPDPGTDSKDRTRTEFTPAPIVGGNTDVGFGGGVIASLARVAPNRPPYVYRIELVSTTMVKSEGGTLRVPYQDDYLLLSLPWAVPRRLRLELRASYTREARIGYYGIGNDTHLPANAPLDDPYFTYDRIHPTGSAKAFVRVHGPLALELGVSYTHDRLHVADGTKLVHDRDAGPPVVRDMITTFAPHGALVFAYGIEWDTRDDRVSPHRGAYLSTRVDLAPGGTTGIPQRWGRWNTSIRGYFPLGADGSALAVRAVSDLLFGRPPFYELARFDETGALGGPNGVRGVPGQRYHGEIKVFANVELRHPLFSFEFLGKSNTLVLAVFTDAGRLWATYGAHPELDGTSLGLKLGLGGGLRMVAGSSFVLRADVAWSPDARPIGAYLAAGHAF